MELPYEIWEKIIVQIKDCKQCIKLFRSLPRLTQKNIRNAYNIHLKSIQNRVLYSEENCMILAVENQRFAILMDDNTDNEIQFVRYAPNLGENGYFVSVDKKGKIIFWDSKTHKYMDCIEIDSEIQNIEFHPSESKMAVSVIRENLGLEIQSLIFTNNGIIFNETIIGYEPEFFIEIVYHPTLSYMLLIRYKNYQIYSIYLWKYEESESRNDFQYSAFQRVELPFIMNSGIEYFENFIYMYYLPFRILENGDFECLGKGVSYYYIIKLGFANNKFYMKENELLSYSGGGRSVLDYIRIQHKIIYLVDGYKIIEQDGANVRIIYQNRGAPISQLTLRKNFIIFLEDCVFKKIDIGTLELVKAEEIVDCCKVPSDFCVL
jgi:hypothetical protein